MNDLIYNGRSLQSFGYTIKANPGAEVAERDIEFSETSGGEGAELNDSGGYKNVDRTYEISSFPYWNNGKSTAQLAQELKDWLYSGYDSYKLLRDSFNPGYFCYAVPKAPNPLLFKAQRLIETSITFTRRPYWYSDVGQEEIVKENNSDSLTIKINNPEVIPSLPYIKVELSGTATQLDLSANPTATWQPITITDTDVAEINSVSENIYNGSTDLNGQSFCDYFPFFKPGVNQLVFSATGANIRKVTIIPNWRRL